jgi:hypothetical protein
MFVKGVINKWNVHFVPLIPHPVFIAGDQKNHISLHIKREQNFIFGTPSLTRAHLLHIFMPR